MWGEGRRRGGVCWRQRNGARRVMFGRERMESVVEMDGLIRWEYKANHATRLSVKETS